MQRFLEFTESFLTEAKTEMLDISIPSVQKIFKTETSIDKFLTTNFRIEEKMDGVKISLIRNSVPFDPDDYTKNWILSYKNHIIYPHEFDSVDDSKIKKESHGISQYKFIHKVLSKVQSKLKNMPENHEFFLEFLMKKPTLTRSYSEIGLHKVIFLSHSPCSFTISSGKIKSITTAFIQDDNIANEFSKITKFNPAPLIFSGPLTVVINKKRIFNEPGIISEKLQARYLELAKDKTFTDSIQVGGKDAIDVLSELFTSFESEFGANQIEGSVLFDKQANKFYKFTLPEQYSKEFRKKIKENFNGSEEESKNYFDQIDEKAEEIVDSVDKSISYDKQLKDISEVVYSQDVSEIINPKKTDLNKQDDLYLKVKLMLIDLQDSSSAFSVKQEIKDENNLGFFVGKMRIITTAHIDIIKSALKKSKKGLIIALVDTSKKGLSFQDRKEILISKFGSKVKIVKVDSANFSRILEQFKKQVSIIYCGEDNEVSYTTQLETFNKKNNTSIVLDVSERSDEDVSATQVEEAIKSDNLNEFKNLTPREVWSFWDQLKTIFS